MQLREDGPASLWRVRRPSAHGLVCSLELYDHDDQLLLCVSDAPAAPGRPERCEWRNLLAQVAQDDSHCALRPPRQAMGPAHSGPATTGSAA